MTTSKVLPSGCVVDAYRAQVLCIHGHGPCAACSVAWGLPIAPVDIMYSARASAHCTLHLVIPLVHLFLTIVNFLCGYDCQKLLPRGVPAPSRPVTESGP